MNHDSNWTPTPSEGLTGSAPPPAQSPGIHAEATSAAASNGPRGQAEPLASRFTRRELEVAAWLGEDITSGEIAHRLAISRETVRAHLRKVGAKLGVRSRHAIVAILERAGIRTFLTNYPLTIPTKSGHTRNGDTRNGD